MKAATIRDVASRAGVSVASVSRVINGAGLVTEATRERIRSAIADLGYVPHSGARSLSTQRTDTVGVILPDLFGEFFSELIRGMDLAARANGLHLIVSSSHGDAEEASSAIRSMRGRVDGLIVLSPHLDDLGLSDALNGRLPALLMNGGKQGDLPSIGVDNRGGATTAVDHLLSLGRRRIAHVAGPAGNLEAQSRRAGYVEAMMRAGLEPRIVDGDFTQASGHQAMLALLADGAPDGVFVGNDTMAIGVLLALQASSLRCPQDVAVVGFDDVPISALVTPGLTTLRVDIAGIGRRALDRLVVLMRGGQAPDASPHETVTPILIVRGSSSEGASDLSHPAEAEPTLPGAVKLGANRGLPG